MVDSTLFKIKVKNGDRSGDKYFTITLDVAKQIVDPEAKRKILAKLEHLTHEVALDLEYDNICEKTCEIK